MTDRPAGGGAPSGLDPLAATRIVLRPIASPMPLGFYTIAIASVVVSGLQVGLLHPGDRQAVALIILPAFILQFLVAVFAFLGRDAIAGTLMSSFAGTWLVNSLTLYLAPAGTGRAVALFFFTFAGFAALMAWIALPKLALAAVLVVAVPRFVLSGLADLTGTVGLSRAAGVAGFALAAVALYTASALLLEDGRGTEVLPVGRRGPARVATEGDLTAQLHQIERAAGVRRTL